MTTAIGSATSVDHVYAVAVQSDGKIVAAGRTGTDAFALARYASDGSLDTSFGTNGIVGTLFSSPAAQANAVAVQSDGKIVAAGFNHNGSDFDFILARYTANGALDTTFGTDGADSDSDPDGYVITTIGSGNDVVNAVALQSEGKIVAAGQSHNGDDEDIALARYNVNGTLDTSFGTGGKVTTRIGSAVPEIGYAVALQSDGKIVVAGSSFGTGGNNDFALVRYNADGSLDTTFGTGGKVLTAIGSSQDLGYAVAVQTDGKIVVAGLSSNGTNNDFALARYNANGALDTTFGTISGGSTRTGKVTTAIGSDKDEGRALAVQTDGKIVVAGLSNNGTDNDFALARYTRDGTLDTTFGTDGADTDSDPDGYVTTAIGSGKDEGRAIALQSDGDIVVAGLSNNGSNDDFALARYHGGGTPLSTDADLSGLTASTSTDGSTFNAVTLTPSSFNAGTTSYTATVANNITHAKLTPTVADTGKATVQVGKSGSLSDVTDGQPSAAIALDVGANAIIARVTAEDDNTQKDYTVTITRQGTGTPPSTDATLSGLSASSSDSATGTFTALTLDPSTFSPATTAYTAEVDNTVTHAKLTPTVADTGKATVQVGKSGSLSDVTDGQPSAAIALAVGANAITVRVTAEDGNTQQDYTVTITREAAPVPTGAVWSATLTVAFSNTGCFNTSIGNECSDPSILTDDDFRYSGVDYEITMITLISGTLVFRLDKAWPTGLRTGTTLNVGSTALNLANASFTNNGRTANWANTGLSWSGGDTVSLSLTKSSTTPTRTVRLSASPNPVDEGSSVTVTATLSAAQTSAVTIPVTITDNTAESGDHGALTSITINANSTTGTGAITTAQDTDADHEVFTVALGTPLPTGITAGTPSSVRITIRDDEATGPAAIWSAALTVQELRTGLLGCNKPPATGSNSMDQVCSAHLSPHTFTHGGTDYEIEKVYLAAPDPVTGQGQNLSIVANPALPENLVLVVGDTTWLSLQDAQVSVAGAANSQKRNIRWKGTDFSWTAGGSVALKLVEPAAGTPTVSLSASPNPVLEGDTVTVTATLSAATASAVNIPLVITDLSAKPADHGSLSSITIAGGATTGTGVITTAEDDNGSAAFTNEAYHDETFSVALKPGLPAGLLSGDPKTVKINIIDDDAPLPKVSLFAGPGRVIVEGESAYVGVRMSRTMHGDVTIPLTYTPGTAEPADYSGPASLTITLPPSDASRGTVTIPEDGDTGDAEERETFTVSINAGGLPNWLEAGSYEGNGGWGTSYTFTIHDTTPGVGSATGQSGGQNDPCDNCGTGGDTGAVSQGQDQYAGLIARMKEWRNDPQWVSEKAHTDRWDRALLAFGETVEDTTLKPMTAAEAQGFADRGWERWVEVAAALRVLQNRAPTVAASIADVTIVSDSGSHAVSLSGVFEDADGDGLTMSAASSDEATATATASPDNSSVTVKARLRGTATITVTAADSYGGAVEDRFTVTVKAAPVVASAISDVSGLETGDTQDVSLSGVFSDADGDSLTVTAASSDEAKATVTVSADQSKLTLSGVAEGTATITVTAQDSDGNAVSDAFQVEVSAGGQYAALIARMRQWRNDPQWVSEKPHTDRWDRALLAFGETVADTTLSPMTAAEAQGFADRGWERWVEVAAALREIEAGEPPEQTNQAPTVSTPISDITIVNESGTKEVSLTGVFSDADNDALTVTAASSDETVATVSAASDGSSLTVTARLRGTATITVTAADGNGGTVSDDFTVTVKAAPAVASAISDVSGLEAGSTQDVSLSGVFSDADGDALTITAVSGDDAVATVSVASDGSTLTLTGVAEGTATITVTAQDSDGNRVTDGFAVSVVAQQQQQQPSEPPNEAPTVSTSIADATIVNESGTHAVSLSGVFEDPDADSLTVTAASSDEAKATVSVSSDGSSLTVNAQARGTTVITVTASDGNGGSVDDTFTVTVKAAPLVASAISDMSLKAGATQEEGGAQDVSLAAVFSDADGDALTFSAETSDFEVAEVFLLQGTLTVLAVAEGTATVTVTAQDSDGNTVSDSFNVSVVGPPTPVTNLSCVAQTGQVLFQWDVPEWSGAQVYAYDYDLTRPDGKREQARLQGYPLVRAKGEYQAGQEASISVKAVYELADGSQVSSEAATLTCTVAE